MAFEKYKELSDTITENAKKHVKKFSSHAFMIKYLEISNKFNLL